MGSGNFSCPVCGAEYPDTYLLDDMKNVIGCSYCTDIVDAYEYEEEQEEDRLAEIADEIRERGLDV